MITWGIVVAGGSGSRFGGLKQTRLLKGRRVVDWSMEALSWAVDGLVLVAPPGMEQSFAPGIAERIVAGRASRSGSVRAGLDALPPQVDQVLIHDAARPLVSTQVVLSVVAALAHGAQAVVPVVPVIDSLRSIEGKAVDRSLYVAAQTPQGFNLAILRKAHQTGQDASDDATLVEGLGVTVAHVKGDALNMKITEPYDLVVAEAILDQWHNSHTGSGADLGRTADDGVGR